MFRTYHPVGYFSLICWEGASLLSHVCCDVFLLFRVCLNGYPVLWAGLLSWLSIDVVLISSGGKSGRQKIIVYSRS